MAEEEENRRRFKIDPDVLDKVEDKPTAMLHLWMHGRLTKPTEDLDAGIFILTDEVSKAEDAAGKALAKAEDVQKVVVNQPSDMEEAVNIIADMSSIAGSASWDADDALGHLKEAHNWIDRLSRALDDYKNAFERLIDNHHPEILEAIEKAELMKELE